MSVNVAAPQARVVKSENLAEKLEKMKIDKNGKSEILIDLSIFTLKYNDYRLFCSDGAQ